MIAVCFRLAIGIGCLIGLGMWTDQLAPELPQSPSQARTFVPQAQIPVLLARPEVRDELELDFAQKTRIDQWLADLLEHLERHSPRVEQCEYAEISSDEREAQFQEIREFVQAAVASSELSLGNILSEHQLERLYQLQSQREGIVALQHHEAIERLQLTHRQIEQIYRLPISGLAPSAPEELRQRCDASLKNILTPDQYRRWQQIIGDRFVFAKGPKNQLEFRILHWLWGFDSNFVQIQQSAASQCTDRSR